MRPTTAAAPRSHDTHAQAYRAVARAARVQTRLAAEARAADLLAQHLDDGEAQALADGRRIWFQTADGTRVGIGRGGLQNLLTIAADGTTESVCVAAADNMPEGNLLLTQIAGLRVAPEAMLATAVPVANPDPLPASGALRMVVDPGADVPDNLAIQTCERCTPHALCAFHEGVEIGVLVGSRRRLASSVMICIAVAQFGHEPDGELAARTNFIQSLRDLLAIDPVLQVRLGTGGGVVKALDHLEDVVDHISDLLPRDLPIDPLDVLRPRPSDARDDGR